MNTEKLIKGCLKQNRRSQNELYKKYFGMMSSIALRYAKDNDQTMHFVNGGFYKIFNNMELYNPVYPFVVWAKKLLINHIIDEIRKEDAYFKNITLVDMEAEEVENGNVLNLGEKKFDEQELRLLLKTLPKVTQQVFNLFAIDGYKHKEIAEMLAISEGTSKWHVNEARKRLKEMMERIVKSEENRVSKQKISL
jgi:RNA polymerase sigma factor (sigma-70 family)